MKFIKLPIVIYALLMSPMLIAMFGLLDPNLRWGDNQYGLNTLLLISVLCLFGVDDNKLSWKSFRYLLYSGFYFALAMLVGDIAFLFERNPLALRYNFLPTIALMICLFLSFIGLVSQPYRKLSKQLILGRLMVFSSPLVSLIIGGYLGMALSIMLGVGEVREDWKKEEMVELQCQVIYF